jgi:predicted RNA-binding protein with RPS1 domain
LFIDKIFLCYYFNLLMQVYRGRVSNTMDFGAFVELQGLRQRYEGLVHVSEISKTRPGSAKDVLKRGQEVWVKVLRITATGGKQQVSLSMRDVDQVSTMAKVTPPSARTDNHWPSCCYSDGWHAAAAVI